VNSVKEISRCTQEDHNTCKSNKRFCFQISPSGVSQYGADDKGKKDDKFEFERDIKRNAPIFVNGERNNTRINKTPFTRESLESDRF